MNNYGATSLLIGFNKTINNTIISFAQAHIPPELQKDPDNSQGIVTEPHISLLTDIDDAFLDFEIKKIIEKIPSFKITFGEISFFKNDDVDVIKIDIESGPLHDIHYNIRSMIPNHYKFEEYNPHCTLAFVKPNTCDNILTHKSFFRGINFTVQTINFNSAKGVSFPIKINRI